MLAEPSGSSYEGRNATLRVVVQTINVMPRTRGQDYSRDVPSAQSFQKLDKPNWLPLIQLLNPQYTTA